MASEFLKARQTRYGAFVAVYLIVIVAIVIVANWLADHHNKTIDVTANKQFTLSDETKKVTGNLKKDVTVYYFDRSDSYDRARDMLDRYKGTFRRRSRSVTSIRRRSPMSPTSRRTALWAVSSSTIARRKKRPKG